MATGGALIRLEGDATAALQGALSKSALRPIAMALLAEIGPAARPALAEIVAGLSDPDDNYRTESAMAIAAVGPEAEEAIGPLQQVLEDTAAEPSLRYAAAYALGRIGPAALPAEPLIRRLAESDDELMATVAVWAALKIKPEDRTLFDAAIPKLRPRPPSRCSSCSPRTIPRAWCGTRPQRPCERSTRRPDRRQPGSARDSPARLEGTGSPALASRPTPPMKVALGRWWSDAGGLPTGTPEA